jgi:hypothetical protein
MVFRHFFLYYVHLKLFLVLSIKAQWLGMACLEGSAFLVEPNMRPLSLVLSTSSVAVST